jgi:hypothetical protein
MPCPSGGGFGVGCPLLRSYIAKRPAGPARVIFLEFSILMLTLMLGNIVQAALFWALIYIWPVFSDVDGVMEVCRIGRST